MNEASFKIALLKEAYEPAGRAAEKQIAVHLPLCRQAHILNSGDKQHVDFS